jgi:hypothetical protein
VGISPGEENDTSTVSPELCSAQGKVSREEV